MYGVGTLTESITTLFGWSEWVFRAWYISGALLGGAPLAQGTVYLLMPKVEVLYATELVGIIFIWFGYQVMVSDSIISIHLAQRRSNLGTE